ncbi:MAG: hypothetical protein ACRYHQ_00800 [Janthinobacterium lividum]
MPLVELALKMDELTMQHQPITDAMTTENLILSLEGNKDEDSKMGKLGLFYVVAEATLAMGLCGLVNFIAN